MGQIEQLQIVSEGTLLRKKLRKTSKPEEKRKKLQQEYKEKINLLRSAFSAEPMQIKKMAAVLHQMAYIDCEIQSLGDFAITLNPNDYQRALLNIIKKCLPVAYFNYLDQKFSEAINTNKDSPKITYPKVIAQLLTQAIEEGEHAHECDRTAFYEILLNLNASDDEILEKLYRFIEGGLALTQMTTIQMNNLKNSAEQKSKKFQKIFKPFCEQELPPLLKRALYTKLKNKDNAAMFIDVKILDQYDIPLTDPTEETTALFMTLFDALNKHDYCLVNALLKQGADPTMYRISYQGKFNTQIILENPFGVRTTYTKKNIFANSPFTIKDISHGNSPLNFLSQQIIDAKLELIRLEPVNLGKSYPNDDYRNFIEEQNVQNQSPRQEWTKRLQKLNKIKALLDLYTYKTTREHDGRYAINIPLIGAWFTKGNTENFNKKSKLRAVNNLIDALNENKQVNKKYFPILLNGKLKTITLEIIKTHRHYPAIKELAKNLIEYQGELAEKELTSYITQLNLHKHTAFSAKISSALREHLGLFKNQKRFDLATKKAAATALLKALKNDIPVEKKHFPVLSHGSLKTITKKVLTFYSDNPAIQKLAQALKNAEAHSLTAKNSGKSANH